MDPYPHSVIQLVLLLLLLLGSATVDGLGVSPPTPTTTTRVTHQHAGDEDAPGRSVVLWDSTASDVVVEPFDKTTLLLSTAVVHDNDDHDENDDNNDDDTRMSIDTRPHEQRSTAPRAARRLNHAFRYLYRHDIPEAVRTLDAFSYLRDYAGYSMEQIAAMNQTFPPLLTLSPASQLHPKLRFLQETLQQQQQQQQQQR